MEVPARGSPRRVRRDRRGGGALGRRRSVAGPRRPTPAGRPSSRPATTSPARSTPRSRRVAARPTAASSSTSATCRPSTSGASCRRCTTSSRSSPTSTSRAGPMEVGPTTHYIMGGIRVDAETGATTVAGPVRGGRGRRRDARRQPARRQLAVRPARVRRADRAPAPRRYAADARRRAVRSTRSQVQAADRRARGAARARPTGEDPYALQRGPPGDDAVAGRHLPRPRPTSTRRSRELAELRRALADASASPAAAPTTRAGTSSSSCATCSIVSEAIARSARQRDREPRRPQPPRLSRTPTTTLGRPEQRRPARRRRHGWSSTTPLPDDARRAARAARRRALGGGARCRTRTSEVFRGEPSTRGPLRRVRRRRSRRGWSSSTPSTGSRATRRRTSPSAGTARRPSAARAAPRSNGRPRLTCKTRLSDFDLERDDHGRADAGLPAHPRPRHRRVLELRGQQDDPAVHAAGRRAPGGLALAAGGHRAGPGVPQVHRVLPVPGRLPRPAQPRDRAAVHGPALPGPGRRPRDAPDRRGRPARVPQGRAAGSATATSRSAAPRSARSTSRSPTTRSSRSRSASPTRYYDPIQWFWRQDPRRRPGAPTRPRRAAGPAGHAEPATPGRSPADPEPAARRPGLAGRVGRERRPRSPRGGFVIRTDGAARGNPGPASLGAALYRPRAARRPRPARARPDASISDYLGVQTNNVAEYTGVVRALDLARELGAREVAPAARLEADRRAADRPLAGQGRQADPAVGRRAPATLARLRALVGATTCRGPRTRSPTRSRNEAIDRVAAGGPASVVRRPGTTEGSGASGAG